MTKTQTPSGQRPPATPWIAFTRTQWRRDALAGVEHGTVDGVRTLCGIPVGGSDRDVGFFPGPFGSCARCSAAANRLVKLSPLQQRIYEEAIKP